MKRLLIVMLLVATAAMTIASGPSSPPAGTRKEGATIVTRPANILMLTNGPDTTYIAHLLSTAYLNTDQEEWSFNKPVSVTGEIAATDTIRTNGCLVEGVNTMVNRAGDTITGEIRLGTGASLTTAGGWYFSAAGFRFPYHASTSPTQDGQAIWDYDSWILKIGGGTEGVTKYLYPIVGTPAHGQAVVYDSNTSATTDNTLEFKPVTTTMLSDVAVTSPTNGQILKWNADLSKYIPAADADTAGSGLSDSSITSEKISTATWADITSVAGADGNDTIFSVGATRDTTNLVGESQNYFRITEDEDSTRIDAPDNAYIVFDKPIEPKDMSLPRLRWITTPTDSNLTFSVSDNAGGGSPSWVFRRTASGATDSCYILNKSLYRFAWAGDDIDFDYLADEGAATGQVIKWDGIGWAPGTDSTGGSGGLWGYTTTYQQWFGYGDDSLFITHDTVGTDTAKVTANIPLLIEGGAGTPVFDFGDSTLDSTVFYAILDVKNTDSNRTTDGELATALASYLLSSTAASTYQPLEATLTDIADGTIAENLVNTDNPWADNEVADNITISALDPDVLTGDVGDDDLVDVASGGTGVGTLTDGGILIGNGTGDLVALGVATNGQIPVGDGTTDPVLATISSGYGITVTNGAGTISIARNPIQDTAVPDNITINYADSAGNVTDQGIDKNDLDSIGSNFVFDDAYRGTSDVADSVLWTKGAVERAISAPAANAVPDSAINHPVVAVSLLIVRDWGRAPGDSCELLFPKQASTPPFANGLFADTCTDGVNGTYNDTVMVTGVVPRSMLIDSISYHYDCNDSGFITSVNYYAPAPGSFLLDSAAFDADATDRTSTSWARISDVLDGGTPYSAVAGQMFGIQFIFDHGVTGSVHVENIIVWGRP